LCSAFYLYVRTVKTGAHGRPSLAQHLLIGLTFVEYEQELKGKELAMGLMAHPDPEVQKQALLCVQKLMVNNWQVFKGV
jgi:V-type H+-transporting ATPase subunit H